MTQKTEPGLALDSGEFIPAANIGHKPDNRPIVIYHDHCTDGFAAAYVAWTVLGDDAIYVPMSYNQYDDVPAYLDDKYGLAGRVVYILDFSIPHEQTLYLMANAERFIWLDHHKTAFEMWGASEYMTHPTGLTQICGCHPRTGKIRLDNHKSGAMLAWEHFRPGEPAPNLIVCIDDRDRWQFQYTSSKAIHAALQANKPWSFQQWQPWEYDAKALVAQGEALLDYQGQQVQAATRSATPVCIKPTIIESRLSYQRPWLWSDKDVLYVAGLAANTPNNMSEVGNELAKASGTFGLVWYLGADGVTAHCSLRSIGDYDVSVIAKAFGGGGHKNAAGFNVPLSELASWLNQNEENPDVN